MTEFSWWEPLYASTKKKGEHVVAAAAQAGHKITRCYGYNTVPDHNNKKCVDFMVYNDRKAGDWIANYCIKNASALGVELIIWQRRIWRSYSKPGIPARTWASYSGPNPHTDHPHVQFNTLAMGKTAGGSSSSSKKAKITKNATKVTLWVLKDVQAFNGNGKKHSKVLKKGEKVTGWVDRDPFGDGRYLRTGKKPHRLWFPLDSGHFSHSKGGAPVGQKKAAKKDEPKKAKAGHFIVAAGPKKGQEFAWPNPVDHKRLNECADKGWFSKHVYIAQHWLNRCGFRKGHSTGYWTKADQKAYDAFRKAEGYKGKDATGSVGAESLRKLAKRAKSNRKVK